MSILGKGSMRDKGKEEELRKSGEAKYAHLSNDLHVLIEVFAPPGEAYSRMSHALEEIKKFLVPDYNDEIRQEQLRELSLLNGSDESSRGRSAQGRSVRPATTISTRGHRGTGRSAAAPRGTAATTHSKLPTTVVTREVQAPRARGAAGSAGYRPPLLAVTHESYDDYGYDDGYGGNMTTRVTKPTRTTTATSQRAFQNITNMDTEPAMNPTTTTRRNGRLPDPKHTVVGSGHVREECDRKLRQQLPED
ncbi:hypothetical protein Q5P01_021367 [Channa striata]|uniref:KH domain-containing, RNA-binding, signal transduction-associated protein 2 n=1 Tax=Channa striata TaxID=64152 RepID=A0AA88LU39_CHASR|nr:hypothetical protein Q5P01_021367 [Channa striata]